MSTNSRQTRKSQSAAEALTFNVSGLLGQPVGSVRRLEVSSPPLDLGAELRQNRGLAGKLRLTRTNRGCSCRPAQHVNRAGVQSLPPRDRLPG